MNILVLTPYRIPYLEKHHTVRYFDLASDPVTKFITLARLTQLVIEQEINKWEYRAAHLMSHVNPYAGKALWHFDAYMRLTEFRSYVREYDHVFSSDLHWMDKWDKPTTWLPMCAEDTPGNTGYTYDLGLERTIDIGFCGYKGDFKPFRNYMIDCMVSHYGKQFTWEQGIFGNDYNGFYNRVKIAWNCAPFKSANFRVFETMNAGCLTMTDRNPDTIKLFEDKSVIEKYGTTCLLYTDFDECRSLIDYYLEHWDEGLEIAKNGLRYVRERHMRAHRYQQIINVMQARGLVPTEYKRI